MIPVKFAKTTMQEFTFSSSTGHFIGRRRIHGGISTMPPNLMKWLAKKRLHKPLQRRKQLQK